MIEYGQAHIDDHVRLDYFAVSLPDFHIFDDDLDKRNRIHCHYLQGLGYLGLGQSSLALQHLDAVLDRDLSYIGAALHHLDAEKDAKV